MKASEIWQIENVSEGLVTTIQGPCSFLIGNTDQCDLYAENSQGPNVDAQVFLTQDFIFAMTHAIANVYFQEATLTIRKTSVTITSLNPLLFSKKCPNDEAMSFIFNHPLFKKILHDVQIHEAEKETEYYISEEEKEMVIIKTAVKICNENFWEKFEFYSQENRLLFVNFIWCIWAQMCKFGILTSALFSDEISEIMVNEPQKIYLEKKGKLSLSDLHFSNSDEMMTIIERICFSVGRRIDESVPYCDARLPDGSRVHAIIPPLALNGPCLTIRKFPKTSINRDMLVAYHSATEQMMNYIENIIKERNNVLISGGTGSGKTTLLNVLSSFIPVTERIITIEDSAELRLQQPHVIRLESRPPNIEGKGEVSLRDLVKNSLRMRPDRVVIGECRGGEALDMLQAMNTGHDGSMTTIHANNPRDALRRLETLVLFASSDLPSRAIREQIASAVQYVVQQTRFADGRRKITSIHRVIGLNENNYQFITEPVFEYDKASGEWKCYIS